MTPEEQAQVNAMFRFYEQQVANLVREGAQAAGIAENLALQLKAAKAEIEALKSKEDNVNE
jgi:DNA-binding NarL/FixJ family response regulator